MLFSILLLFSCTISYGYSITDTVSELDISKYVGHWYQMYGAPFDYTFQGYGKCITADYRVLSAGNVSVLNSQISKKNELQTIGGYAYYEYKNQPGKLTVHLDGTPKDFPYWVVKLGEVVDGEYQYSVITTPSELAMWVLARDIDVFAKKYDAEVRQYLDSNNFTYVPIQQTRCLEDFMVASSFCHPWGVYYP